MRQIVMCVALSLLAACASEEEIRQAQAAADRSACLEIGFQPDTDSFRLCRLMQANARRIDSLSLRVNSLDAQIRRPILYDYRR